VKQKKDMKALSRLAHAAKAKKKHAQLAEREWPLGDRDVASEQDCEIVSAWVSRLVGTGRMGATEGKVVTVAVHAWLKAHEQGAAAADVQALKAMLEELNDRKKGGPGAMAMRAKSHEALSRKQKREQAALAVEAREVALDRLAGRKVGT
jgi:hypothetical protein